MKRLNIKTGKPFKLGDEREDGYKFYCYDKKRLLVKGFYQECWLHPDVFKKRMAGQKKTNTKRYIEHLNFLNSLKLERGCACCGYKEHVEALEWDHINPSTKKFCVTVSPRNKNKLDEEISKCQVLCGNCHNIKTCNPEKFKTLMRKNNLKNEPV